MLNDPSLSHLIRWSADGESFVVVHPEEFSKRILSTFFKHSNFSSFVRQLHLYGFSKSSVAGGIEFSNSNFRRGREDLLSRVSRKTVRGGSSVKEEDDDGSGNMMVIDDLRTQLEELKEENRRLNEYNSRLKQMVVPQGGDFEFKLDLSAPDEFATAAGFPSPLPMPTFGMDDRMDTDSAFMPPVTQQDSFERAGNHYSAFGVLPDNYDLQKSMNMALEAGEGSFPQGNPFDMQFEDFGFGF